ncbi:TPA: hypothetical protein EYP83_00835 [Candidatus Geothermarchaeota archaeon]|nr:hypothetical protein [Candidatus Geothermarchaeota archaeon]HIQ13526.1 hypothetical protein [Thermoprotei archaeon]
MTEKIFCPRFLADHMNGDLARWLRIMGFDCLYPENTLNDKAILEICEKDRRILLTRDKELHSLAIRRGLKSILIRSNTLIEKFREIYSIVNLNKYLDFLKPRCTICNSELKITNPNQLKEETDPPIYRDIKKRHNKIFYCDKCRKIYWEGSHWNNIMETLEEIKNHGKNF